MSVSIIISNTSGGDALSDLVDFETVNPGLVSDHEDFFIRHTAVVSPITDCAFYITSFSGVGYPGSDADADYEEILGWGDDLYAHTTTKGALYINQTVPAGWVTGEEFSSSNQQPFRNGYGDVDHQIVLSQNAINRGDPGGVDGIIPVNGEAHIQLKVEVPTSVSRGAGVRAVTLVFAYSATS